MRISAAAQALVAVAGRKADVDERHIGPRTLDELE
jgi:hypothetical protein